MEEMFKPAWSTEVISEYKWKRWSSQLGALKSYQNINERDVQASLEH